MIYKFCPLLCLFCISLLNFLLRKRHRNGFSGRFGLFLLNAIFCFSNSWPPRHLFGINSQALLLTQIVKETWLDLRIILRLLLILQSTWEVKLLKNTTRNSFFLNFHLFVCFPQNMEHSLNCILHDKVHPVGFTKPLANFLNFWEQLRRCIPDIASNEALEKLNDLFGNLMGWHDLSTFKIVL